jgi:hypothetical protein
MQKEYLRSLAFVAVAVISSTITSTIISNHSVHAATSQKNSGLQADSLLSGLPAGPSTTITPPFLTKEQLLTKGQDNDKVEITNLIYTYGFYHDSGNGAGVTSLFTKDGAIEGFWNNNGNVLVGRGCLSRGEQIGRIASVDAAGNTAKLGEDLTPRPFPGHSHNVITNVLVQVSGDTASLHAYFTRVHANVEGNPPVATLPNTAVVSHTGEYVSDLKRTPEGWRFYRHRIIGDVTSNPGGSRRPCPQ